MKGWDGVRAWRFIRASEGYRKAWRRHNPPLGLPEPAPFPVRLQTGVDLAALEWGMFAWEDPYAERPTAPFWVRARESAMASSCSWDLGCCGWAQLTLPRPSNLREVARDGRLGTRTIVEDSSQTDSTQRPFAERHRVVGTQ